MKLKSPFRWNKQANAFLFFLLLSAAFWLFTMLNEETKDEISIPVELINVPQNVVITTATAQNVQVTVRDKGFFLLRYKFRKDFTPLTIDFNNYRSTSGYINIAASDLLKQISQQLASSTQISGLRPQQIEYYFNYGESKRLPVKIRGEFEPADMTFVSSIRYAPDSVMVFAKHEVLDTMQAAYTDFVSMKGLTANKQIHTTFAAIPGVKYEPDSVGISVSIDRYIEKTVQVPVEQVNFPATKILRTFPSNVNVTFQVGMKMYKKITDKSFVIAVDYEDIRQNTSPRFPLMLRSIPDGVRHAHITPSEVDYVIEDISNEANKR